MSYKETQYYRSIPKGNITYNIDKLFLYHNVILKYHIQK